MRASFLHQILLQTAPLNHKLVMLFLVHQKVFSYWVHKITKLTELNKTAHYLMNSESKPHSLKKHIVHCRVLFHSCLWLKFHRYPPHVLLSQLHWAELYLIHHILVEWIASSSHRDITRTSFWQIERKSTTKRFADFSQLATSAQGLVIR